MRGPNASFGVQMTSMKKTFGFRSFLVFRISDTRTCTVLETVPDYPQIHSRRITLQYSELNMKFLPTPESKQL
jgi:hypothetical protein